MPSDSSPSSEFPQCLECNNTGIPLFQEQIYYVFCGLLGPRCCSCSAGNKAFKQWCQSEVVQKALKQRREKEVKNALAFSGIPQRWEERTLEKLEGHENIKQSINRYLDNFQKYRKEGRGIYFWLSNDLLKKKTHVLSGICQKLIHRFVVPCIFMREREIFSKIKETFHNPEIKEYDRIHQFRSIECLFIDNLGSTPLTNWKSEILADILDYRFDNALPTFFSSMYSLTAYHHLLKTTLQSSGIEEIPHCINEMCRDFIIEVKD